MESLPTVQVVRFRATDLIHPTIGSMSSSLLPRMTNEMGKAKIDAWSTPVFGLVCLNSAYQGTSVVNLASEALNLHEKKANAIGSL